MITVQATREGLVGKPTACGWLVNEIFPFVALPSRSALHCWVKLLNPANGRWCCAQVLDVGPWNVQDDDYVFRGARPAAERGESVSGKGTNGAGIDLGEFVWHELGMADNGAVSWEFIA